MCSSEAIFHRNGRRRQKMRTQVVFRTFWRMCPIGFNREEEVHTLAVFGVRCLGTVRDVYYQHSGFILEIMLQIRCNGMC